MGMCMYGWVSVISRFFDLNNLVVKDYFFGFEVIKY